jgi:hypothetical protein
MRIVGITLAPCCFLKFPPINHHYAHAGLDPKDYRLIAALNTA